MKLPSMSLYPILLILKRLASFAKPFYKNFIITNGADIDAVDIYTCSAYTYLYCNMLFLVVGFYFQCAMIFFSKILYTFHSTYICTIASSCSKH